MMSNLPAQIPLGDSLANKSDELLINLTGSLRVSRDILSPINDIHQVLNQLPSLLTKIPQERITKDIAKLCVACSVGLFDSGINYIWNEAIRALRLKLKNFGLPVVAQILTKNFGEQELDSMMDAELLKICFELNLISQEGYFFLDQCRDIRNNFSAAHPSVGNIAPFELLNFFDRCINYAYDESLSHRGIIVVDLVNSLKGIAYETEQLQYWVSAINDTFDDQKACILEILHGVFCDEREAVSTRNNCFELAFSIKDIIPENAYARILNTHAKYILERNDNKVRSSRWFFEKLELLSLLPDSEKHGIIMVACDELINVHLATNNFYNEPPSQNVYMN